MHARVCTPHTYIYIYLYIYRNIERRASSTEIRSVYICRQPPSRSSPSPLSTPCLFWRVHESRRARKFLYGTDFSFRLHSQDRLRDVSGIFRLAIGDPRVFREASSREVERASGNERASELSERNASPFGDRTMRNDE